MKFFCDNFSKLIDETLWNCSKYGMMIIGLITLWCHHTCHIWLKTNRLETTENVTWTENVIFMCHQTTNHKRGNQSMFCKLLDYRNMARTPSWSFYFLRQWYFHISQVWWCHRGIHLIIIISTMMPMS